MGEIKFYWEEELNEDLIYSTWKAAFNKNLNKEYWRWRFLNNPNDSKVYIGYILEDNVLASYYAISPIKIQLPGNRVVKSGLVNMAMTHPDFQGKGYLTQIGHELHEILRKEGYCNLISFPTRGITHEIFKKNYEWHDVFTLYIMSADRNSFNLSEASHENVQILSGKLEPQIIQEATSLKSMRQEVSPLWDYEKLCWRLIDNPINDYYYFRVVKDEVTLGLIFYKLFEQDIDIMEYFYSSEMNDAKFKPLTQTFKHLIDQDLKVNIWANQSSENYKYLEQLGFKSNPLETKFGYIPLNDAEDIDNSDLWHISFIDSDVY